MPSFALANYLQLIIPLTDASFDVHAMAWDDPHTDGSLYEAVISRSTWDDYLCFTDKAKWYAAARFMNVFFQAMA